MSIRSSGPHRAAWYLVFFAAGTAILGPGHAAEPLPAAEWERLESVWRSQRDEIKTAQLKYRLVRGATKLAPVSAADVNELAREVQGLPPAEAYTRLCSALRPGVTPRLRQLVWDGTRYRDEDLSGEGKRTAIFDGRAHVTSSSDGYQVSLVPPGDLKVSVEKPDAFRWIHPNPSLLRPLAPAETDGDVLTFGRPEDNRSLLRIDARTGDVLTAQSAFGKDEVKRLTLQLFWKEFPGNVRMPAVSLGAEFRDRRLSELRLSLIEVATFNAGISDEAFVLATTKPSYLVDQRPGPRTKAAVTMPPTDDVVKSADAIAAPPPRPAAARPAWRPYLFAAGGVGVPVAAVALVMTRRRGGGRFPSMNPVA